LKYLIAVDGLDGCGKDTHATRIREAIERSGREVTLMRHPSGKLFGRMSKLAVQGSGPLAMSMATAFYTMDVLSSVRAFNRSKDGTFMFVRYLLGTAYLPFGFADLAYEFFRKLLPFPDLALFIDIEPSVAIRRIELRDHKREMFETTEKLSRIRGVAQRLTRESWEVIDNSADGEEPFLNTLALLSDRRLI
jgi:dTMP kinase